ncbi:HNH endonuclease [Pseudomonas citronellolis]|uniref:HNH endonuclease n=1 Tax=Pseudomonas citronellolis TaxID=53408 RepID=UPI00209DB43A|nr:HNH endonuclease [Pseudomonas citronellolis]MCP1606038.1 5-methylcytosine-specific restriction protein A [Pseudomonas citronellolis]MCP1656552.1 5-methylcytosine-specific restriction protein A [Pseudomonas citronellolis]MCP1723581.1 5-methylcytosine-specific restriction protein A [Pseudomonas citronellolis]
MKLDNFRRWAPEYTEEGKTELAKGNKDEGVKLATVVAGIRNTVETNDLSDHALQCSDEPEIHEAAEGEVLTRLHCVREHKKKHALAMHGHLACEACGFDFQAQCGNAGAGVIDTHHVRPFHTLQPRQTTCRDDLALLCANCHRIVHATRHWLSIEELRATLEATQKHV